MTARLREIGMKESPVEFNESLYGALDETGRPVAIINERVHRSVIATARSARTRMFRRSQWHVQSSAAKAGDVSAVSGVFAGLPIVD
jgi:hypothetical protein